MSTEIWESECSLCRQNYPTRWIYHPTKENTIADFLTGELGATGINTVELLQEVDVRCIIWLGTYKGYCTRQQAGGARTLL
jgi:hypothetical protein